MKTLLVMIFILIDAALLEKAVQLKQRVQMFLYASKHTQAKLTQLSHEAKSVCIATNFNHSNVSMRHHSISLLVNQLMINIQFLDAICDFTYNQQIFTPKMHHRLRQEKHEAKHITKIFGDMAGIKYKNVGYMLKEKQCNKSGARVIYKTMAQVYMNFQILFKLIKQ